MGALSDVELEFVNHYAPLHYLPWIARDRALLSKSELRRREYPETHFRATSWRQDSARGFKDYAFLTIEKFPQILNAKLKAGFPHIAISVPVSDVEATNYSLCRYNIARTRILRRGNLPGRPEGDGNGQYYREQQVPVAFDEVERKALLKKHLNVNMIEVLVPDKINLSDRVRIVTFSPEDKVLAKSVLRRNGRTWPVDVIEPTGPYNRKATYVASVKAFIERCFAEPAWKGSGLDFDRLKNA